MDRFVAGPRFYNYDMFGGLRAGGDVQLHSRAYFGLAVAAFASAFVYIGLRSGLLLLVCAQLQFSALETQAVDRLAELPAAFAFLVGATADAKPLVGFHRKAYIIMGLLLVLLAMLLLSAAFCFDVPLRSALHTSGYVALVTLLIGTVSVGSMVAFVSTHTMVVALSQRETLERRGELQAKYLLARVSGQIAARLVVLTVDYTDPPLRVPLVLLALSAVAIASLATTISCLDEREDFARRSVRSVCATYCTLTQQKAVWRVLAFISCFAFALGFRLTPAQRALRTWSHADSTRMTGLAAIMTDGVTLCSIVVWRRLFMNSLWRRVFAAGPAAAIASQLLLLALTTTGVVRDAAFYTLVTSLAGVASALVALSTLVPVTEIAQEGAEGGVAGLALSSYTVAKVFGSTFLSALQHAHALALSDPIDDSRRTRQLVAAAQVLTIVAHALGFAALALLPLQKLDAQQLRTFGGFTWFAGRATLAAFLSLLLYCVVFNVLMLVPSTARAFVSEQAQQHAQRRAAAAAIRVVSGGR